MKERVKALLVQNRHDPLDALRQVLEEQSIDITLARNCAEAALALWSDPPPHIAFTDVQLTDGNWADVLTLSTKASAKVNVVVVAPHVDVGFYLETIERGAFDFIVPPHAESELLHVIRSAAENALTKRQKRLPALPSPPHRMALPSGTYGA